MMLKVNDKVSIDGEVFTVEAINLVEEMIALSNDENEIITPLWAMPEYKKLSIITVDDFEKAVKAFGINSPIVTAVWNTMAENPDNNEEFETIYHRHACGFYDMYKEV